MPCVFLFLSRLAKSVRSAAKNSRYSFRDRHDSGYESNEETDNYLEDIVTNYQQDEHVFSVYPFFHETRSPSTERRETLSDDFASSAETFSESRRSSASPRRAAQRSASMSPQKSRRVSSTRHSQTLKPIIHRRSTIFNSTIGSLIRLTGTPRFNNDDETYVSTRFRNENTSKFVIGTLWNTFALVNNLFLQRARKRRNAISGDTNIQADQLAYLQRLYSLAERDQANEIPPDYHHPLVEGTGIPPTRHLESIASEILSTGPPHRCNCFGTHHTPSCIFYDHSVPYFKPFSGPTSRLEGIVDDIKTANKPHHRDATTQSSVDKPMRSFARTKPTSHATTQSSPVLSFARLFHHVSTQYDAREDPTTSSFRTFEEHHPRGFDQVNASTQYSPLHAADPPTRHFLDVSTQISPVPPPLIEHRTPFYTQTDRHAADANTSMSVDVSTQMQSNTIDDVTSTFANASTQFSSSDVRKSNRYEFTQPSPIRMEGVLNKLSPQEEVEDDQVRHRNISTQLNIDPIEAEWNDHLRQRHASLLSELKEAVSSGLPEKQNSEGREVAQTQSTSAQTVRNLVSIFETVPSTTTGQESNLILHQLAFAHVPLNNVQVLSPPDSTILNISTEGTHSSVVHDTIEQYAAEMASSILDNAVLTTITTPVYHHGKQEQLQLRSRFSSYNNGGGHGKSLLFQSNTFVPAHPSGHQEEVEEDTDIRGSCRSILSPLTKR